MQETDRDGGATFGHQPRAGVAHLREVERRDDLPVMRHALGDLDAAAAWHDRVGEFQEQVVDVVALLDAELEHVAEAARRQQAGGRAAAFDQGVGDQRGAVQHLRQIGHRDAGLFGDGANAGECPFRRIGRRGQAFVQRDATGRGIKQHEIGEGAADVEAEAVARG